MSDSNRFYSILKPILADLSECFSRKRGVLTPKSVLYCLLQLVVQNNKGYQGALEVFEDPFWWSVFEVTDHVPTKGALSKARKKMSEAWFWELFCNLRDALIAEQPQQLLQYHDFRLVAVDATDLELPIDKRLTDHFGERANQNGSLGVPYAGVTAIMDIGRQVLLDFTTTAGKPNERAELKTLIRSLRPGDLLLADRGYPSREIFHALREHNVDYLIRMTTNQFKAVDDFLATGEREAVVTISGMDKKGRERLYDDFQVRLLREDKKDQEKPAVYATSLLDIQCYTFNDLTYLYTKRWAIETSYRELKMYFDTEKIHARTVLGVKQELIVTAIYHLFLSLMELETYRSQGVNPVVVERVVQRATQANEPEITVPIRDVLTCTYTFSKPYMMQLVGTVVGCLLTKKYDEALWRSQRYVRRIWRNRQKRRPGRSYSRVPKSANAKNKTARRASQRTKKKDP
jgi:hypothetical protein